MIVKSVYTFLISVLQFYTCLANRWNQTCDHYKFRQSEEQYGMHIICAKPAIGGGVHLSILKDAYKEIVLYHNEDTGDVIDVLTLIYEATGTSNNRSILHWLVCNYLGATIHSIDSLIYEETTFIFTNGNWVWPGVKVGYDQYHDDDIKLTTLSLRPLVLRVSSFLTHKECDYIREVASPHLVASATSKMDKDIGIPDTEWRTSSQAFLSSAGHPPIQSIDRRVAELTRSKVKQQEYLQVLRYEEGQKYDQHTDYFDPKYYQKDLKTLKQIKNGEVNRLITVLWYLSNVTSGGETLFPESFSDLATDNHNRGCSSTDALKVQPVKGDVIVFYSLFPDGTLDPSSVHAACPVGEGETKWAANKWVWSDTFTMFE